MSYPSDVCFAKFGLVSRYRLRHIALIFRTAKGKSNHSVDLYCIIVSKMMLEMLKANELAKRNGPIVSVKQGKLMGSVKIGSYGVIYQMFLGIPYATPPDGELRFKVI